MYPSGRMAREILSQTSKPHTLRMIKEAVARVADPKHRYTKDEILEVMRAIVDALDKLVDDGDKPKEGPSASDWVKFATALAALGAGAMKLYELALEEERKEALALEEEREKALPSSAEDPQPKSVEDIGPPALTGQAALKTSRRKASQISEDTRGKEDLGREATDAPVERMQTKKGSRGEPSRRRRRPPLP